MNLPALYAAIAYIVVGGVFAGFCYYLALQKGKNPSVWILMGFAFNVFALLLLGFTPSNRPEDRITASSGNVHLPEFSGMGQIPGVPPAEAQAAAAPPPNQQAKLRELRKAGAVFGDESADSYYDEGITASMRGDLEEAITYFQQAIHLDNGMSQAYHQLAKCYLRLNQARKAAALLEQVVRARPKQPVPRVDLGYALLQLNEAAKARDLFAQVSTAFPENVRANLGLGYCAYREGQWEAAMQCAQTALAQGGQSFAPLYLLGRAARQANHDAQFEAFDQADSLMRKSIETNPDQPEAYFLRGEASLARGDLAKALEYYNEAIERSEPGKHYTGYNEHFSRTGMLVRRGLCLQQLGNMDAARETGKQILEEEDGHPEGRMLAEGQPLEVTP